MELVAPVDRSKLASMLNLCASRSRACHNNPDQADEPAGMPPGLQAISRSDVCTPAEVIRLTVGTSSHA